MLKMKKRCERCAASLAMDSEPLICSFECTFCSACGHALELLCPNCSGELVRRPQRLITPAQALIKRIWRRGPHAL